MDLTKAKTIAADYKVKFAGSAANDIYKQCQDEAISLSDLFERLDPTPRDDQGKALEPFDAFERMLIAHDLQLSGPNQLSFGQLMASAEYLTPELIRREIEAGMNVADKFNYKDCIAATVPSKGTYHPLYIPELDNATVRERRRHSLGQTAAVGSGGNYPVISVVRREKDILLAQEGRDIEMAYQVIRDYGWSDVAVLFRLIGAQISSDKLFAVYQACIVGDGTVGAATNTFNGVAGTLTYLDLVHNNASFNAPFSADRILAPLTSFERIVAMAQFQDPEAFGTKVFQMTGQPVTPFGARLKQVGATPGGTPVQTVIATIDSRFAIKEVQGHALSIESEKIISRSFEHAVVSEETAFAIIADGALRRIIWT